MFKQATKTRTRLRLALMGPSGSGKTYTALRVAHLLHPGGRIAYVDTEHGSASKYVGERPDGTPWAFDVLDMAPPYHPDRFVSAIQAAGQAGYDVLVIDSLTHAWSGSGGMLQLVDEAAKRARGNSFAGWKDVKPIERRLYDAITGAGLDVICCMRSKTEYVIEEDDRGKKVPRKIGLAPEQRADIEYEFDLAVEMTHEHDALVSKTRCPALARAVLRMPGRELADPLRAWLSDGAPAPAPAPAAQPIAEADRHEAIRWLRQHDPGVLAEIERRLSLPLAKWEPRHADEAVRAFRDLARTGGEE